jgi:V/A-type H+-transporting ATPase subunit D
MALMKVFPTRINLIRTRKTLKQAESGLGILERKRDVLIRELRHFKYDAKKLREEVTSALVKAFRDFREANVMVGSETVANVALATSLKAYFVLDHRSIMGVTVPIARFQKDRDVKPEYGFGETSASLDRAFREFYELLDLIAQLAEIEGALFQISYEIKKTQRRVNALKYISIPMYRETVKNIELTLEEREREEFVRTKMAKRMILERSV